MKLFVWDFHGVLEKGNDDAVLEITNITLERHGHHRRMTADEATFLAGKQWHEYFAFLLPGHAPEEHLKLQTTCFGISQNQPEIVTKYIQLNDHAAHVLESIHNSDHTQILISNTMPKSLDMFVNIVGVEKYFPPSLRFGVDSHQQKSFTKKHCLDEFLKEKHHFKTIISIGDSPSDMDLIDHYARINGVAYLYSYPTRPHRQAKCHHKINDLRMVLQEITTPSQPFN